MDPNKLVEQFEHTLPIEARLEELNEENIFMLYAAFCGDVERTAHAANLKPTDIIDLATKHGWNEKLRGIIELKNSGKPGDVERAINRALNFVQAHQYRMFLQRIVKRICGYSQDALDDLIISEKFSKEGLPVSRQLSTRALADLASALEKCHALTYLALNDSTTERRAREDKPDENVSGSELHAQIARAMSDMSPGAQLADAQPKIASP